MLASWMSKLISGTSSRAALVRAVFQFKPAAEQPPPHTQGLPRTTQAEQPKRYPLQAHWLQPRLSISVCQELPKKFVKNVVCRAAYPEILTPRRWGGAH